MPKVTTEQLPDGKWKATDGNDFCIMETEEEARRLLDHHLRVREAGRFCPYCQQSWNYCICAAMAD